MSCVRTGLQSMVSLSSLWFVKLVALLLLLQVPCPGCHAFINQGNRELRQSILGMRNFEGESEDSGIACRGRRVVLGSGLLLLRHPQLAVARTEADANLDALLDLPPVTKGCVRIFLCRHGQTENNRLRKVQGARVDPPINQNGAQQASNLGKALRRLNPTPNLIFSSVLQRAQLTAQMAAAEIDSNITVRQINSLAEVDFGPMVEGKPVALVKASMEATYAAWATGNIDFRPHEGGDSGRDVLERAIESITTLATEALKSDRGCCVAVTHSTFLRILIALASDVPLVKAASLSVVNGGVSVIDVPRDTKTRRLGRKAKLFGGIPTEDFDLEIPICHVIRVNESRYLPTVSVVA